jgi:hypothetical protein
MKKPTVTQIKDSGVLGEYFFSRDTLKFFNQSLSSFTTAWFDREAACRMLVRPSEETVQAQRWERLSD